jgi:hypothetical protein
VTRPPTTPCARAILSAIITTIVVVWLARALAIYQIPAIRLLPRLWMRLPSLALLLAASEIALIAAIGLIALLISATSKAGPKNTDDVHGGLPPCGGMSTQSCQR